MRSTLTPFTLSLVFLIAPLATAQTPIGTAFTYQGELTSGGVPVDEPLNGCDFEFTLWDADVDGSQVGATLTPTALVADGGFTVALDFGADIFVGDARWLEIAVCCPSPCGDFTSLAPRQELTPTPYSLHTPSAESVPWTGLIDVPAGFADDVDDDALGALSCANGEVAKWDGAAWQCGEDIDTDTDTLAGLSCASGQVAKWTGADWVCDDDQSGPGDGHSLDASDGDPVDALFVDAEGFVGIGTTTPATTLDVEGRAIIDATGSGQAALTVVGGPGEAAIQIDNETGLWRIWTLDNYLYFTQVPGATHTPFRIHEDAENLSLRVNPGNVSVGTDLFVTGNIGIGTTNPGEALDVAGNMHASGTITSGSSITIDGVNDEILSNGDLELHVANGRAFRLETNATSPNLIGGYSGNAIESGTVGATIGGGGGNLIENEVFDDHGTIAGGFFNRAGLDDGDTTIQCCATVGGGADNAASGRTSTVAGGDSNTASGMLSTVGGGNSNTASGEGGSVGGGLGNEASALYSTVAGGSNNSAFESQSFIGGGSANTVNGARAAIVGGTSNTASGEWSFVGAGVDNEALGNLCTVAGGTQNMASGSAATIGGGSNNMANGNTATIGGGLLNTASGTQSTVGGGWNNTASSFYSTVPGGRDNVAGSDYSFAAGRRAKADHNGTFVWGDSTNSDVASSANDQFTARAVGGARFFTNTSLTTGVELASGGGSWSSVSSRDTKANVDLVDGREVLERLRHLPIATWNYKAQDESIRHIGPMAQDFAAAFGVGEKETMITTIDADGVALAAIQGLHEIVKEQQERIAALETKLAKLIAKEDK